MMERDDRTGRWRPVRRRQPGRFRSVVPGLRAGLRTRPVTATIDGPPNDALWRLYDATQAEGAQLTWQPSGDAIEVDIAKHPPKVQNRVFLHLRGELRGQGPTSLTGSIAPDLQARVIVGAPGLIFLVGSPIVLMGAIANLAFGHAHGAELFLVAWGTIGIMVSTGLLSGFARADESLERIVREAAGEET